MDILIRFKFSTNALEKEIFACVICNLIDEYKYHCNYTEANITLTG